MIQLPFHHGGIRDTERFLSQLGDYCTAMANKSLNGTALDEKELHTMLLAKMVIMKYFFLQPSPGAFVLAKPQTFLL